ncbi:hypothetical protein M569_11547 [Genlisea aurea]|uniref:Methyltransferase type 11 domain-containing protein n=1 Tax=Genlisea aurea TaxID=192259 RepID=S8DK19_9LAMI|nr:hypothetical protein M569_11547 [Genlisea aurea]
MGTKKFRIPKLPFFLVLSNVVTLLLCLNVVFYIDGPAKHFSRAPPLKTDFPAEFVEYTSPKKLPGGYNSHYRSDTVSYPVGHKCVDLKEDLERYMTYEVNGTCPDDEKISQRLLLSGCEPLPRRRCHNAGLRGYEEPLPVPDCFWSMPPDSSVSWTAYTCKDYKCLKNRHRNVGRYDDCIDCFDLNYHEKFRWIGVSNSPADFSIDRVLAMKKPGTIRIGLDIGGSSGTFAVRMREKNVTIVATTVNLNGSPFSNFVASRGIVPLYVSIFQRLPFFDGTLDIVHTMNVLSHLFPDDLFQLVLFDVYRVLRPGGLFWLDHFFYVGNQLWTVYVPLIETVGFDKLLWVTQRKLDRGIEKDEMYLSALFQKPME